ncbi:AMP-binding protein [Xanthobacter aminoxidans]|uniref:AMP-binding protein n=1 Tax=Xanthobacter aminoxidans TaxID=186280 RepID=UPI00372C59EC
MSIYDDLPLDRVCHAPLTPLRFLDRAEQYFADRTSVVSGEIALTWRETAARCRRLASALARRGVGPGDTVSVLAPNGLAIYEAHFGVPMTGAVLNAVNTRLEPETVAYILAHCEAKVLLVDTEFSELARQALATLAQPPLVVDIADPGGPGGARIGSIEYEDLLAEGDPAFRSAQPSSELQPITLGYTSGTTGKPKGVVYDHRNAFVESLGNMLALGVSGRPRLVWVVPIFHANGWCYLWPMAGVGATNILVRKPSGGAILGLIARHGATHVFGAPVIAQMIAQVPAAERPVLSHKVRMLTAGAPPTTAQFFALEQMGIDLDQGYGLSEVWGPAIFREPQEEWAAMAPAERAALKVRQGIPNLVLDSAIVADPLTLEPVPRDGTTLGEVMFRGNVVMRGYLKNREATREAFAGGYFHSGDLAVWHQDGAIELKDRSKDIIISGGENISSIEIENAICAHPHVLSAAVVGVPSARWGESPFAFVEVRDGVALDAAELEAHCRARLASFKVPCGFAFGPIPKTATGKVQKFLLRQQARENAA